MTESELRASTSVDKSFDVDFKREARHSVSDSDLIEAVVRHANRRGDRLGYLWAREKLRRRHMHRATPACRKDSLIIIPRGVIGTGGQPPVAGLNWRLSNRLWISTRCGTDFALRCAVVAGGRR